MKQKNVLVVGGTGLIGSQVIAQFPEHVDNARLTYLGRQGFDGLPGHLEQFVTPIAQWEQAIEEIKPDIVISCLGTTMKKAGSKEAFAAIDRNLLGTVVGASKRAGATHFIAVSSTMANSGASSFYLKIKGQAEDLMREAGFDRLDLIRPGLLRGQRTNDMRIGESLAIIASPLVDNLLHGSMRKYRSIEADIVALAILALLAKDGSGEHIHENDAIRALSRSI